MDRPAAGWIGPASIPRNCCSSSSSYPRWDSSRSDNSAASRRISKRPSVLPVPRRPRSPLLPGESGEVHRADDRGLLPGSANYSLLPRRAGRRRLRPSDAPAPEARRQHPSARPARPHHCAPFRCPWLPFHCSLSVTQWESGATTARRSGETVDFIRHPNSRQSTTHIGCGSGIEAISSMPGTPNTCTRSAPVAETKSRPESSAS